MLTTIDTYLEYVAPAISKRKQMPVWPPDVFAIAAALLSESGAYTCVTSDWPPRRVGHIQTKTLSDWIIAIQAIAKQWRNAATRVAIPPEVQHWWHVVQNARQTELRLVKENRELSEALLQLCSTSDEASDGAGLPPTTNKFELEASLLLRRESPGGSTLCKELEASPLRVLPKLHTPQSGLTLNSLSHHLALCRSADVQPRWYWTGSPRLEEHSLNLLLIPWPEVVRPSEFHEAKQADVRMPAEHRFFSFKPGKAGRNHLPTRVAKILKNAERLVGQIDGVVFPELSLTMAEYEAIRPRILRKGAFLVCGLVATSARGTGQNFVRFDVPMSEQHAVSFQQNKHHRWRLDKQQIVQYGLGSSLNPECNWWEHIELTSRELMFVAMRSWLTVSVLICEDLARQHPVAEVVRSIGPNLVLSVLMDGPQLAARWPARYATVLADDPGCSVLTLSSLGMVGLCRPLKLQKKSRTVALWKDAKSGTPVEVDIPDGAGGVILSLTVERIKEWTADGRHDDQRSGYPILSGIHPVPET